jgi:hypothetical protein
MGNLAGILGKLLTVALFGALLYYIIDFVVEKIQSYMQSLDMPTIFYFLCKLGVFEAFNIVLSLTIASWFTNKIIAYLSH